jgi:hypothetical protein
MPVFTKAEQASMSTGTIVRATAVILHR